MTAAEPPPRRVLYADDNRPLADITVRLLRLKGFDALACYDGEDALRLAGEFGPAVCFLDLDMPGLAGDEVAAALAARPGRPALVAVTGVGGEEGRRRTAGFDLYLVKPADPERLLAAAEDFCRPKASDAGT
jgi:CheY-like chemotaxis protein